MLSPDVQPGHDAMGRIILEDGVQRMMSKIIVKDGIQCMIPESKLSARERWRRRRDKEERRCPAVSEAKQAMLKERQDKYQEELACGAEGGKRTGHFQT